MRVFGILLALVGAIMLGYQGFGQASDEPDRPEPVAVEQRPQEKQPGWNNPVLGGIAVTAGLLIITVGGRKA